MKHLKNIFLALFIASLFSSCSSDDGESTPVGGDHSYDIDITSGFLSGSNISGVVPNSDFIGLYIEDTSQNLISFPMSLSGPSNFTFGGAINIVNGQASTLNDNYDSLGGSTLLIVFDKEGETYAFESISGTCSINNLSKSPGAFGTGIASYTVNFSGTFRQTNSDEINVEDYPLVQMSGEVMIKQTQ
ncbi:hypothetical protein M0M57_10675 [Flavobacterium azooxidireducens]|uniref:Lipoprotein n=1 Tax=Flavobacterium azooxidireducens TaxID=1871076 RepID=A0ABY4KCM7_9FLAO|nr:hypothetical protein [Flavobacterium azooxidireducens]UPQ78086.1 hypothetical protein M0M57_10675 [Flavobacterium azooxidireducens]